MAANGDSRYAWNNEILGCHFSDPWTVLSSGMWRLVIRQKCTDVSESKSWSSKQEAYHFDFRCLAYTSTLKIEAELCSETSVNLLDNSEQNTVIYTCLAYSSDLKFEAVYFSETSVECQTTGQNFPEGSSLLKEQGIEYDHWPKSWWWWWWWYSYRILIKLEHFVFR
jgi:hypothetical protein